MTQLVKPFFLLVLLALISLPAYASKKVALVIGNNQYQNVPALEKAVNDADRVAGVLEATGFKVIKAHDLSRRKTNQMLHEFVSRIEPGDVAMLYYAGHGVEIQGQNYLLPVDVPASEPGQEGFVKAESIALANVLARLRGKHARLNIVVLDACRNNPFKSASSRGVGSTRGLAAIMPPKGTFILYSADAGEAALDALNEEDRNPNSVFTRVLVPLIEESDKDLVAIAREVRRQVKEIASTVRHDQTPAYYDAVLGDFYFTNREFSSLQNPEVENTKLRGEEKRVADLELVFWRSVEKSENVAFLDAYIQQYPQGQFVSLAQAKINVLKKAQVVDKKIEVSKFAPIETSNHTDRKYDICETHLLAYSLTTGKGGNALDCYREILQHEPGDERALTGISRIESKYVEWTRNYIIKGQTEKATYSLRKLRKVNPDNEQLVELGEMLSSLEATQVSMETEESSVKLLGKGHENGDKGTGIVLRESHSKGDYNFGTKHDDEIIETSIFRGIGSDPVMDRTTHVIVTVYSGIVLLTGEVGSREQKIRGAEVANSYQGVLQVVNQLGIIEKSSLASRFSDTLIAGKLRAVLARDKEIDSSNIKVVTTRGVVYLLGQVGPNESDKAVKLAQGIGGVQRIVKLFIGRG